MKMRYFFWGGLLLGIMGWLPIQAKSSPILAKIQQRYQQIESFKGNFTQRNYRSQNEKPRQATGVLTYVRPGKMRWDYHKPNEQLLITDGTTLWLFDPLLENVTVQALEKVTPGTPLSFLLGIGNLEEEFEYRPTTQNFIDPSDALIVEMKPKKPVAALDFIQLAVDPKTFDLKQIVLVDLQGNYRSITLEAMQYNLALDTQQFHFEITPEMEVIEVNE